MGARYRVVGIMPLRSRRTILTDAWESGFRLEPPQNAERGTTVATTTNHRPTQARCERHRRRCRLELRGIAEQSEERRYPEARERMLSGRGSIAGLRDAARWSCIARICSCYCSPFSRCSLVECVNLASANLARGAGRARELAIRTVLGAGRGRLARQLLTENALIALCGGARSATCSRTGSVRESLALNHEFAAARQRDRAGR